MFRVELIVIVLLLSNPSYAEYVKVPVTSARAYIAPVQENPCVYKKVYYSENGRTYYEVKKVCPPQEKREIGFICCTIYKGKNICKLFSKPVKFFNVWDDHGRGL